MARRDAEFAETKDTTCITSANSAPLREKFCMKESMGGRRKWHAETQSSQRRKTQLASRLRTPRLRVRNSAWIEIKTARH